MKIITSALVKTLLLSLALSCHQLSNAQTIIGFWEVKEVKVGKEIKTPVAKWTKINSDGSFQSGNGWLQNSEGTWTFDDKNKFYSPLETNGIIDEFGGFKVSFQHEQMIWERDEDGERVIVLLQEITKIPKSTSDILVGIWNLKEFFNNGKSEKATFDPNNKHFIFIRWDRIYVERTPQGDRTTGYWHINGHKPEVTFISHVHGKEPESWNVSVNENELQMVGISDSNKNSEMRYERMNEFPD